MQVLLVDDDDGFLNTTAKLVAMLGHNACTANTISAANAIISASTGTLDSALIDLMLPDGNGLELLDQILAHHPDCQITIVTGNSAVKSLVKSMYGPNVSYLIKPVTLAHLKQLLTEDASTTKSQDTAFDYAGLIGNSPAMQQLYNQIERVAKTRANVLLIGESGVGKEVVANAIHFATENKGDLVTLNCGALSRELIGSELFGHEKGAFTGATTKKPGIFELGDQGSVFLDEITEMPIDMQPNLLRVLETERYKPLGGTRENQFEARVISATNRDEASLITTKALREDLYFRLAVFPIHIPPLRARKSDIPALARYFLNDLNQDNDTQLTITSEAINKLQRYDWPGNVRELRHFIHRAFIMTPESATSLEIDEITSPFGAAATTPPAPPQNESTPTIAPTQEAPAAPDTTVNQNETQHSIRPGRSIAEVEKELIEVTLQAVEGDKQKAATMLGLSLKTLYNRLNRYESMT